METAIMQRREFLLSFAALTALPGCGNGSLDQTQTTTESSSATSESNAITKSLTLRVQSDGSFQIVNSEGSPVQDDELARLASQSTADHSNIEIIVTDDEVRAAGIGVNVGRYRFMVRWEPGYVAGCIRKNGWHINLQIRDIVANRDLINYHMMGWRDGNSPQFGIYESASGWCRTTEGTFTRVADSIRDALSRMSPSPTTAVLGAATAVLTRIAIVGFSL